MVVSMSLFCVRNTFPMQQNPIISLHRNQSDELSMKHNLSLITYNGYSLEFNKHRQYGGFLCKKHIFDANMNGTIYDGIGSA